MHDLSFLKQPVQIAYAVPDAREAALHWATTYGAGPFFLNEHIQVGDVRYRGQPAEFDHTSAYGQWGKVMVELVQDHTEGPSAVKDVVPRGQTGLHHMAFFVDDMEAAAAALSANGWPEAMYASAGGAMGFAFHDAVKDLGHMIEIYPHAVKAFYDFVESQAQGWDGSDPVRSAMG